MKDTCDFENCYFGKLFDSPKQCPNYIETGWRDERTGEHKTLKDCAPKRLMLMVQGLSNDMLALNKINNEQRNESQKVIGIAKGTVVALQRKINHVGQDQDTTFTEG